MTVTYRVFCSVTVRHVGRGTREKSNAKKTKEQTSTENCGSHLQFQASPGLWNYLINNYSFEAQPIQQICMVYGCSLLIKLASIS